MISAYICTFRKKKNCIVYYTCSNYILHVDKRYKNTKFSNLYTYISIYLSWVILFYITIFCKYILQYYEHTFDETKTLQCFTRTYL